MAWSLDAFCIDEDLAKEAATIIESEAKGVSVSIQKLEDKLAVQSTQELESMKGRMFESKLESDRLRERIRALERDTKT